MDEGRKRALWICAAILAERRLSALEDGKSAALQAEVTQDAISKAERIMRQIDVRWPGDKVQGKS
jgi:hypothetical protein